MLVRISSAIAALLLIASQLSAQVPPEKALATFQVNDPELEWTLWAHEPMFANPTCMDIDHLGRVWVCESVNYRHTVPARQSGLLLFQTLPFLSLSPSTPWSPTLK